MGKFRVLLDNCRAFFKPGISENFNPGVNASQIPLVDNNNNVSPAADNLGSAWVRDASKPSYFVDSSNPLNQVMGYPYKQIWSFARDEDFLVVGQENNLGRPCALYSISAMFGDPATPWATSPYYLQVFSPYNLQTAPLAGTIPVLSFPCPRPNEGQGRFELNFGVDTPFNCVEGTSGGACIAFSVTPYVYTNPGGFKGNILANWAYYSYQI